MGWKDAKKIKNDGQVWRFFTPTFLHGSAYHINANLMSQLFLGNGIEFGIGPWWMIFLYFTTGFGGMLLSCIFKPESFAIGASTSVFGLVGFLISYVFSNWQYMKIYRPWQTIYLSVLTSLIVVINMNIGPMADGSVDNYGHLGGLLTGMLCSLVITEQLDRQARSKDRIPDRFTSEQWIFRDKYCNNMLCNYIFHFLLFTYIVGGLVMFYVWTDVDIE